MGLPKEKHVNFLVCVQHTEFSGTHLFSKTIVLHLVPSGLARLKKDSLFPRVGTIGPRILLHNGRGKQGLAGGDMEMTHHTHSWAVNAALGFGVKGEVQGFAISSLIVRSDILEVSHEVHPGRKRSCACSEFPRGPEPLPVLQLRVTVLLPTRTRIFSSLLPPLEMRHPRGAPRMVTPAAERLGQACGICPETGRRLAEKEAPSTCTCFPSTAICLERSFLFKLVNHFFSP